MLYFANITRNFVKNIFISTFFLLSISRKEKYTLNSIVLQNLLLHLFNYSAVMYFMNFMKFVFNFSFFILQPKKIVIGQWAVASTLTHLIIICYQTAIKYTIHF